MNNKLVKLYEQKITEEIVSLDSAWRYYKAQSMNSTLAIKGMTPGEDEMIRLARNIELQAKLLGVLGEKLKEAWKSEEES